MRLSRYLAAAIACGAWLAFLTGCTMWRQKAVTAWSQATGGEHFERLFWKEVQAKNWQEIEKRLAPTFVSVGPNGTRDRAATLAHLKTFEITDYLLSDVAVQPNGTDLVVTYTITLRGSQAGQPLPATPMRMMTVWQHLKKGWMAIAHSRIPAGS